MDNNKIPCGGFRIGDGLTMDGNTLKSLEGAYVKVKTNDRKTFEFMDDSPLKTFEEIAQKAETSPVTLLMFIFDSDFDEVFSCFYNGYGLGEIASINFCTLSVAPGNRLIVGEVSIDVYNKITFSRSKYTLTPVT